MIFGARTGERAVSKLAALMLLAACSSTPLSVADDGGNGAVPPPPETALSDACTDLVRPGCAAYAKCSPDHFAEQFADEASCVSLRVLDCVERRSAPGNTVAASDVAACALASAGVAQSCDAYFASVASPEPVPDPACAFAGTLADGAACIDSGQCASGACARYALDACGTCVTRAAGPCQLDRECPFGSFCQSGVCQEAGALGDACSNAAPCASTFACMAGTCQKPPGLGESCPTGECAPNLWCNYSTAVCERPIVLSQAGADCTFASDGSERLCPSGLTCSPSANGQSFSCQPARTRGSACGFNSECGPGLACFESACGSLSAARCVASSSTPSASYPASHPSVPTAAAGSLPTLLVQPKIVLITFAGDPNTQKLQSFVSGLPGSSFWQATTSEYGVGALTALPPVVVAEVAPQTLSDGDLRAWLSDKLANDASFPANDSQTIYTIAYPAGTSVSYSTPTNTINSCYDFGGYHTGANDTQGNGFVYAVIPYCGYGGEEGSLSHEAVEAATDPYPSSGLALGYSAIDTAHVVWSLPGGSELADFCTWQPLAVYDDGQVGGRVQRSWSNASMAAFHHPCAPVPAGRVYFNAVPALTDTVRIQTPSGLVATRGVSIPLGQSRTIPVSLLSDGPMPGPFRVSAYGLSQWLDYDGYGRADPEPTLRFQFDQQSGVNGDTLQLTVTPVAVDSTYASEPFVLVSRFARDTNVWLGLVGQD